MGGSGGGFILIGSVTRNVMLSRPLLPPDCGAVREGAGACGVAGRAEASAGADGGAAEAAGGGLAGRGVSADGGAAGAAGVGSSLNTGGSRPSKGPDPK
jgi:hypothetical protein